MTTLSVTTEFRHEYEAASLQWLRKRFLWYTGIMGGLGLIGLIVSSAIVFPIVPRGAMGITIAATAIQTLTVAVFVGLFLRFRPKDRPITRDQLIRIVSGIIIVTGLLKLASMPFELRLAGALNPGNTSNNSLGLSWMLNVGLAHFLASCFIPWKPIEAFKPLVPLIVINAIVLSFSSTEPILAKALIIALSPLAGVPGIAVAALAQSRFRAAFARRMFKGRYLQTKQELSEARRIHESLFPAPITSGPIRLTYRYEPMRDIGGDYLFARLVDVPGRTGPVFDAALIDVTGHGIAAALTVNRLHGEIQRQLGETPGLSPGDLLTGLNAYLHHTLASHSVYATAICLRIDPEANTLEWASAGHPPAFLCTADGRLDRLDSTAFILGVTAAADYDADQQVTRFMPGDSIVVYTDGAIEARDARGRHLRVDGLQRILASSVSRGDRAGTIVDAVDRHRAGPAEDDTLIVEIARPV